ncbi:MAG TPA: hypothetical protein VFQ63_01185, partial [Patescibacteria group bacterium]|nr:hypothetical protein [Patescibacteria group bacterium]
MSAEFSPGASVAMTASFEGGVSVGLQAASINSLSAPMSLESAMPSGLSFTPGIESGSQVFGQASESLPFSSSSDEAVALRIGELAGELGLPQFAQSAESVLAERGLSFPAEAADAQDGNSQLEGVVEDGTLLGDSQNESLLGVSDEGTEPHALDAQEDTLAESSDNESEVEAVDDSVSETDAQESSDESEDTDTKESDENSEEPEETDETN